MFNCRLNALSLPLDILDLLEIRTGGERQLDDDAFESNIKSVRDICCNGRPRSSRFAISMGCAWSSPKSEVFDRNSPRSKQSPYETSITQFVRVKLPNKKELRQLQRDYLLYAVDSNHWTDC